MGLLAALLPARPASAQAANYEAIRIDLGLVGGYSEGVDAGGFGGVFEPKFLLHDNIAIGLRIEGIIMFGASLDGPGGSSSYRSGSASATLVKAEYLLGTWDIRPFASLGIGIYSFGGQEVEFLEPGGARVRQNLGRHIGIAPQIGIELARLRLAVTYNTILGAGIEVEQTVGDPSSFRKFSQNYYSIEFSFHFGGSRKPMVVHAEAPGPAPAPPPPEAPPSTGPPGSN